METKNVVNEAVMGTANNDNGNRPDAGGSLTVTSTPILPADETKAETFKNSAASTNIIVFRVQKCR